MTPTPRRIQLRRTQRWRIPPNTVSVARPTAWGNHHLVGWCEKCKQHHTAQQAVDLYVLSRCTDPIDRAWIRSELRGKNLACWCAPAQPCHGDALLAIANEGLA